MNAKARARGDVEWSDFEWKSLVLTPRERRQRDAEIDDILFVTWHAFGGAGVDPLPAPLNKDGAIDTTTSRPRQVAWSIP